MAFEYADAEGVGDQVKIRGYRRHQGWRHPSPPDPYSEDSIRDLSFCGYSAKK